jgi:HAE1 family hydrophobic/amphiphilic exporter-1
MKIVNFAVKRPVTITILVTVVIMLGIFTYSKMGLNLLPEMKLPVAAVMTTYTGAGPEEVEQVSKTLEGTLAGLSNVKTIQSISSSGSSIIILQYNWGTDMDLAATDIREKIGIVEKYLPAEVDKPMVIKMDPNMMPILQLGISGGDNMSLAQLQSLAEDVIEPRLSRLPDIASVVITGGLVREVKVDVDPVKLQNYGLSLSSINQVLQAENFNMSSGTMVEGQRKYYVRSLQQFESIDDIKKVAILNAAGSPIYLRDIATITDGYKDDRQMTRVDQKAAVGISCLKQSDANTVEACNSIKAEIANIQKELGVKLNVKITVDQSDFINKSLNSTKTTILEGSLMAILVLFLFLRNMRSTLIVFTAIPLSIVATFVLMYFNGSTLNLITLGGLALGLGRMIDDSIVVFENIYRHRTLGLSPLDAALTGASEVGNAVIASTLTIMVVFLPIIFTEGIAGIIFKPLGLTVGFAVFCSLLVALTVVPLMSSRLLTDQAMEKKKTGGGRIARITERFGVWLDNLGETYKKMVAWALSHRKTVISTVTVLMLLACAAVPLVGAEFMPKMDSGEISIALEMDKGTTIDQTEKVVNQMENILHNIPEVKTIFTSIGGSGNMFLSQGVQSDQGAITVKLVPRGERKKDVDTVSEQIRQAMSSLPGAKITVSIPQNFSMGTSTSDISVQVRGDDLTVLRDLSNQISTIVRNVPGTREVTSSLADGNPEMQIRIDRERAATYGLTPIQVAAEIKNAMQGTIATRYKVSGQEVDVRVGYTPQNHDDYTSLENLKILTALGAQVELSQIASFELAEGPISITRVDQVRQAEITGSLLNRDLKAVMSDIQTRVDKINLPAGYTIQYGGSNQDMIDSFKSLALALLIAIILVYAVMAILYESFFTPFVIMFSIPTAFIGVVAGLLITGRTFNVTAFIGVIMLVGVAVANAIVLVDYIKRLIDGGMERNLAIIEAGRVRLRPILMTALATILAMLPMATGLGEGAETQAPMATVVIGGLLASTFITLLLIPVVYSLFDDWGQKIRKRWAGRKGEITAEQELGL